MEERLSRRSKLRKEIQGIRLPGIPPREFKTYNRDEIESKAIGLFDYGEWKDTSAQRRLIELIWGIEKEKSIKLRWTREELNNIMQYHPPEVSKLNKAFDIFAHLCVGLPPLPVRHLAFTSANCLGSQMGNTCNLYFEVDCMSRNQHRRMLRSE